MKLARIIMMATLAVGMLFGVQNNMHAATNVVTNFGTVLPHQKYANIYYLCDHNLYPVAHICPMDQFWSPEDRACVEQIFDPISYSTNLGRLCESRLGDPRFDMGGCELAYDIGWHMFLSVGTCTSQSTPPSCKINPVSAVGIHGGVRDSQIMTCRSGPGETKPCNACFKRISVPPHGPGNYYTEEIDCQEPHDDEMPCQGGHVCRCDAFSAGSNGTYNQGTANCACYACAGNHQYVSGPKNAPTCTLCPTSSHVHEDDLNGEAPLPGYTDSPNTSPNPTSCYLPKNFGAKAYHDGSGKYEFSDGNCRYDDGNPDTPPW